MSVIAEALRILARVFGFRPGPDVERLPLPHWFPIENSAQWEDAGPDRCWWCLAHDVNHTRYTKPSCPRQRPSVIVELP